MFEPRGRVAVRFPPMAGLAAATLLLASCATGTSTTGPGDAPPTHTRTPVASTPAASPSSSSAAGPGASIPAHETAGQATSDRGLPVYAAGQQVELEGADGTPEISFTVTSLSVEDTCPVDGGQPENGAFALVEVEASFAEGADADAQQRPMALSADAWSFYPEDGKKFDGELGTTPAASCQQAGNALPAELKPGSSVRGTLVLDIPHRGGALTLADVDTDIAEWPLP